MMVLGESGLVGSTVFILFLMTFFSTCKTRRYTATSTLLVVFLTTNLAEATFFSPAGGGGVFWSLLVIGGFTIDMSVDASLHPSPEMLYSSHLETADAPDEEIEEPDVPVELEPTMGIEENEDV